MSTARFAMKAIGVGRLAIGLGLVVAPTPLSKGWIGDSADTEGGKVAVRALGARDALLGFMALHVASSDDPLVAARWSSAIALCDVVDGVSSIVARGSGRMGANADAVTALALGSALAGLAVSAKLRSA